MLVFACADPAAFQSVARSASSRRRRLMLASSVAMALLNGIPATAQTISANGVDLGILTNVTVNAPAGNRAVIAYNPGGAVTLVGGNITAASTIAQRSIGLLARTHGVINSTANITTTGNRGHAVQAGNDGTNAIIYNGSTAGTVNLGGGLISTNGEYSLGLHTTDSGIINANNVTILTTGVSSYGGQSESMSTINLNNASITTSGALAAGIVANNDRLKNGFDLTAAGGIITASNTAITTSGLAAAGALASHGSIITLQAGSVTTSGDSAAGLVVAALGRINSSADINTQGLEAHGVVAGSAVAADGGGIYDGSTAGTVTLTGGAITTAGAGALGLVASDGGVIHASGISVSTTGTEAHGALIDSNSGLNLSNGSITASGTGSHGLLARHDREPYDPNALGGSINVSSFSIATNGDHGHGALAQDGARITLTTSAVTTSGTGSHGLFADNGGQISSFATILTTGADSVGALASNAGQITLAGGTVTTSGANGQGLLAHHGGHIGSSADIATAGNGAHAVQAGAADASIEAATYDGSSAGTIVLAAGHISTTGVGATGLHATDAGTIEAGAITVITSGAGSYGAHAASNSVIDLAGSGISTSGSQAHGLLASNARKQFTADATAGSIHAVEANISASGADAYGARAEAGGRITLTGGSVGVSGAGGAALSVASGGQITSSAQITAAGVSTSGAIASAGGKIALHGGSIAKSGNLGFGMQAHDGGEITSSINVTTTGDGAHAVQAGGAPPTALVYQGDTAGQIDLTGGAIATTGTWAIALHAVDGGQIRAGSGPISTTGALSTGVVSESSSLIELAHSSVTTAGAGAHGLLASNDRRRLELDVAAPGGVIRGETSVLTTGAGAHAGVAEHGGRLELIDSSLSAQGAGAAGLMVADHGVAVLDRTSINSAQDSAIRTHNSASIVLGSVTARGATAAITTSFSKPDQLAAILVGPGSSLSSANGVLLSVDRSGAGGDSGVVALALAGGSVADGDIVDLGTRTTGFTDVVIRENATWVGAMKGIRHIVADEIGAHIHLADGSSIAGNATTNGTTLTFGTGGVIVGGNVFLSNQSTTSGGSIDHPIHVQGDMNVDASSFQGGNWRINGGLTNYGALAPGNSIGLVQVGGNLNLGAASVYHVEIDAQGNSDLVTVGGQAFLAGRTLVSTIPANTGYLIGRPYTIVSAAGGLGGTRFDGGASWADGRNYIFLAPVLSYDSHHAYLTVSRTDTPMDSVAETPNQAASAGAVDRLPTNNALFVQIANLPTADAAARAFAAISGDAHASFAGSLVESSHQVRDALNDRLRQAFDEPANQPSGARTLRPDGLNLTLWGQAFGSRGHASGANASVAKASRSAAGFIAGADAPVLDNWRVGFAGGYTRTSMDTGQRLSSASADSYHVALYAGGSFDALAVRLGAAYTWNDASLRRSVTFPGFAENVTSSYSSGIAQIFGETSYTARFGATSVEPFAALAWVRLDTDRFQERGGLSALTGKPAEMNVTFTTLGARLAHTFTLADGYALTARGTVGWRHAFGDVDPRSWMSLAGGASSFNVTGAPIARNSLLLEAGLDMNLAPNVTLGISWTGQLAERAQDQSIKGNFTVRF